MGCRLSHHRRQIRQRVKVRRQLRAKKGKKSSKYRATDRYGTAGLVNHRVSRHTARRRRGGGGVPRTRRKRRRRSPSPPPPPTLRVQVRKPLHKKGIKKFKILIGVLNTASFLVTQPAAAAAGSFLARSGSPPRVHINQRVQVRQALHPQVQFRYHFITQPDSDDPSRYSIAGEVISFC